MLNLLINLSRFAYILLMILFILCTLYCYKRLPSQTRTRAMANYQVLVVVAFFLLSAALIVLHTFANDGDLKSCVIYLSLAGLGMLTMHILSVTLHKGTSRMLWNAVWMLLSISITILWRLKPSIAIQQIRWILICLVFVNVILAVMRMDWIYRLPAWLFAAFSGGMILLPFVFPYHSGGALNWASIHNITFQPSEFVKISYVFFVAFLYAGRLRFKELVLTAAVTGFMGLVLLKQNDLGGLLIFCILFLFMSYEYIGKAIVLWGGILFAALAAVIACRFVPHVRVRVDAWLNPWADITGGGYQIAHSLFAIVGGGWFGSGLFRGLPTYIPINTTDMIFSAIAEEFGTIFAILLIVLYGVTFVTILKYGEHELDGKKRTLLLGFSLLFMTQTFLIIGGSIKLIPLTGVTLPFISYGGSSMISMFTLIGIVQGIIRSTYAPVGKEEEYDDEEPGEISEPDEYDEYDGYDTVPEDRPRDGRINVPFDF